jgi:hypothetical protein
LAGIQTAVIEVFHVFPSLITLPLDAAVQATGCISKQTVQNGRIVNYESERTWKRVAVTYLGTVIAFVWELSG